MPKLKIDTLDDWLNLEKKFEDEVVIHEEEEDEGKENNIIGNVIKISQGIEFKN